MSSWFDNRVATGRPIYIRFILCSVPSCSSIKRSLQKCGHNYVLDHSHRHWCRFREATGSSATRARHNYARIICNSLRVKFLLILQHTSRPKTAFHVTNRRNTGKEIAISTKDLQIYYGARAFGSVQPNNDTGISDTEASQRPVSVTTPHSSSSLRWSSSFKFQIITACLTMVFC